MSAELTSLQEAVVCCRLCPRLVSFRELIAQKKRAAYIGCDYWGKPVPSLGSPDARLLIVGLAPAAHGGNRTGRMFTGDRSGDFLFRALHRFGFANQPESRERDDGLSLIDAYVTAVVRCAPPDNRPLPDEKASCRRFLSSEIELLGKVRVVVVLGRIAWQEYLKARAEAGRPASRPYMPFSHGGAWDLDEGLTLICSYHPSQQNTLTGRLTESMFDDVFRKARTIIDGQ